MPKYCRSCGEPLTVAEAQLDDKLGPELSVCLSCVRARAALREIKKEELIRYYYRPDEIDV
ncbi:MAG TPA: hypothetical protein VE378_01735 [Nitrososphaeraceae archaeon]|jgi:hypothetical protein|nr:hypothetical protein [Nitrososphaeraceae archaeon]